MSAEMYKTACKGVCGNREPGKCDCLDIFREFWLKPGEAFEYSSQPDYGGRTKEVNHEKDYGRESCGGRSRAAC